MVLGVTSLVLVAVGATLAFVAFRPEEKPTPESSASPAPDVIAAPTPKPVACGAKLPKAAGSKKKQYSTPKEQKFVKGHTYLLRLDTSCGRIDIELAIDEKPITASSVAFLAREGFYDGLVFHRVVNGFVIQGGDPEGNGSGGPGYQTIEVPSADTKYTKGIVAMAKSPNAPPGGAGSQFFIVGGEDASLPPDYAVLGKVVAGDDAVAEIQDLVPPQPPGQEQPPKEWVYIEKATVVDEGAK
jgi:cyclophilin family peptidyl-prolyl cis-trans isomerase